MIQSEAPAKDVAYDLGAVGRCQNALLLIKFKFVMRMMLNKSDAVFIEPTAQHVDVSVPLQSSWARETHDTGVCRQNSNWSDDIRDNSKHRLNAFQLGFF